MIERFSPGARQAVVLAQQEARLLNHAYIGTEHLLLGLLNEGEGPAARALAEAGVSAEAVRRQVEDAVGRGAEPPGPHLPFTPAAKKSLELSLAEALRLRHEHIGTEHMLLGLLAQTGDTAVRVLVSLGADPDALRQRLTG